MDIERLFLWTICFSCAIFLIRTASISVKNNRGWIVVSSTILAVTIGISRYNTHLAVIIGGILWLVFLLIPSYGFSRVNYLVHQHYYRKARRLVSRLYWLHPADGWQEYPKLLRGLELAQSGDIEAAIAIFKRYQKNSPNLIRHTQALLYWIKADWRNCLLWFDERVSQKILLKEPNLLIYYLRCLGETGNINGLLKAIEFYKKHLEKLGNIRFNEVRLFALAFCGQTLQVKQLCSSSANEYSTSTQKFWLATAQMAIGKNETAREQLLSLRTNHDFILGNAVEWRLANPPAILTQSLDGDSRKILARIATEVSQELKYKNLANLKQIKAYATYGLITINLIFFALEIDAGGSENLETLYELGALVPQNVWLGEWWRLLNANFLHYGWIHLTTNMLGLYLIGRFVESAIGFVRYLIVYLTTGLLSMLSVAAIAIHVSQITFAIGNINIPFSDITFAVGNIDLSLGGPEQRLVGASAAIMGLIGTIVALFLRDWRKEKSRIAAKRLGFVCLVIAIQFFFDFNTPEVSFLSHFLGLIIGFAIASILLIK